MTLTPLRILRARAPSGGEIRFVRYTDCDKELSWYTGLLQQEEEMVFWRAKNAAQRPGAENWARCVALLVAAGWTVIEEYPE